MPVERLEDPPLVTGRGRFVGDINFPRQLHMRIVRSNHAHGKIVSIATKAARALPGVVAIWTSADIPEVPPIDFREGSIPKLAPYLIIVGTLGELDDFQVRLVGTRLVDEFFRALNALLASSATISLGPIMALTRAERFAGRSLKS
jgi:CO/xanthine dehydrogenase Mo-binding subunit